MNPKGANTVNPASSTSFTHNVEEGEKRFLAEELAVDLRERFNAGSGKLGKPISRIARELIDKGWTRREGEKDNERN